MVHRLSEDIVKFKVDDWLREICKDVTVISHTNRVKQQAKQQEINEVNVVAIDDSIIASRVLVLCSLGYFGYTAGKCSIAQVAFWVFIAEHIDIW